MLRINLLPSYVAQKRLSKRLIAGFTVAGVLLIAGLILYNLSLAKQKDDLRRQADTAVAGKSVTDGRKAQAASIRSQVGPIQAKVDFVKAVHDYNNSLVKLYYTLAYYTDSKVIYSDASYSGTTMTVKAYVPSIAEVGRYLQGMYRACGADSKTYLFKDVSIDKIPGYPDAFVNHYYLGKTLVSVGAPPAGTGAAGSGQTPGQNTNGSGSGGYPGGGGGGYPGGGGGGYPGGGGGGGGYPGGGGGGGGYPGGGPSVAGGGAGGGFGQNVTPLGILIQKQLNPLASPRQQAEFQQQLLRSVRVKRAVQGFAITVTLTLNNPPVAPTVPSGTGSTAPAAGGSAYPGGGRYPGLRTASNG